MNKIYSYFEEKYNENKIAQSFIIGNTILDNIIIEMEKVLNDFFFMKNISIDENPDVFIVKPENNNISKDTIKDLLLFLKTTSQITNKKVYIIDQCEKLNDYSYNALLKILEEPKDGIYAFLITTNIDSINKTILSRCQQLFVNSSFENNEYDEKVVEVGDRLIKEFDNNNIKAIAYSYDLYNIISDRDLLKKSLEYILNKYSTNLNELVKNTNNNDIITIDEIKKLSKKMIILNDNINRLDYYLNKNLSIDRIIIEMWRCENENSGCRV